tara:strand:+ start:2585 stop:2854 length:270 start_codon:yes stop_codon:yes gene_type:complete
MNFLIGPALIALAGSFAITRAFEFFADILMNDTPEAAKGVVFTGAYATMMSKLGMTRAGKTAQNLKARADLVSDNKIVKAIIKKGTETK